jgi:hypothetical protein
MQLNILAISAYVASNCGNKSFPEMPGVSSIALTFAENLKLKMVKFWEIP